MGPEKKSPLALFFLPLGKLEQEDLGAAVSQGYLIPSSRGSRRPGMHQQRARERARARERERERAIAEEKDMEEKLEAAIRSATACVKQVDQDVGEDPKVSSSLESANSPRLHSIMAMSWQWCAGKDS